MPLPRAQETCLTVSPLAAPSGAEERRRLNRVLRQANTMVMHSEVSAPEDWLDQDERWAALRFEWTARFEDEDAAQAVLPLDLLPGETYYEGWIRAKHPDDLMPMAAVATRAFRRGDGGWEQEFRAVDRAGRVHWFSQVATIVCSGENSWRVTTINTDVTALKEAQEAVAARERELRALADNSPDFVLRYNRECRVVYANPAIARALGVPVEAVIGRALGGALEDTGRGYRRADIPVVRRAVHEVFATGELREIDVTAEFGSGIRYLNVRFAPEIDDHGHVVSVLSTSRDFTALKEAEEAHRKLEEQLRQSQKMEAVGRLAGGIAHDFNNLLTVVQMQTSLVLSDERLDPDTAQAVMMIMDAAQRAAALTRQLLTFSRQQAKQARALDVAEVVSNAIKLLRRVLGEDIGLETRFASGLPPVHADPGMLEQVVMNLAVNARDAMPDGGHLTLTLEAQKLGPERAAAHPSARAGSFVCLTVADTGCGIAPEHRGRIFEPFFTTKDVGKGTGLGLATVFGIVEQHQGWIELATEVGKGTTFRVYLPALEGQEPAASAPSEPAAASQGGGETVLIVEDEVMVRAAAAQALERGGYRTLEAGSAAEALRCWEEQGGRIDLLVTDLVMPGGTSGEGLASELRRRRPALQILYTSGYNRDTSDSALRLEPGQNFLPKPYGVQDLLAIVRSRLDKA